MKHLALAMNGNNGRWERKRTEYLKPRHTVSLVTTSVNQRCLVISQTLHPHLHFALSLSWCGAMVCCLHVAPGTIRGAYVV